MSPRASFYFRLREPVQLLDRLGGALSLILLVSRNPAPFNLPPGLQKPADQHHDAEANDPQDPKADHDLEHPSQTVCGGMLIQRTVMAGSCSGR
jgi:hypothetical protein